MIKKVVLTLVLALAMISLQGQRKVLNIPDIPGYVTLKCDFHMHTVFSDGNVWPVIRVNEAWRDGLDVISITDHIEYTPHKNTIPRNHNAAWDICQSAAQERNIILIHGAEITRSMPPGHLNALFITDAAPLDTSDFMVAIETAVKQGAFIEWNHPGWKRQEKDGIPKFYPVHRELISKGWLHGIEYFNEKEFYPLVFDMCRDNKLALMGNSDVHGAISESYTVPDYPQRPMTLVFAKARTEEAVKEALFAGRTAVWYGNYLAGFEQYTAPIFRAAVSVGAPYRNDGKSIWFEITNRSDLPMNLTGGPEGAPSDLYIPAGSAVMVKADKKFLDQPLRYQVSNIITGNGTVLSADLTVPAR